MTSGKDLANFCIDYGQKIGGSYVEARYMQENARGLAYRNGQPISGGKEPSEGIGVRILTDGNLGFASFDRLSRELAKEAIDAAYRMAKASRRKKPIDFGKPVSNEANWSVTIKQPLSEIDTDTIMETVDEMNTVMEGLASYTVMFNPIEINKYFVNSEGSEINGNLSYLSIFSLLTAKGAKGSEQKMFDQTQAGGWERIKEGKVIETLEHEVAMLKRAANEAEKVQDLMDRPIDMIVGPEVAGIIAHENVGHPSEGDRIMGREGAQAGESFWRDLKIGESRVGSDAVTVCDDPSIDNTAGFYAYDDEGVKSRNRILIKNGIIHEPLLNREFGARFEMESNGAARSTAYNREPIIRMANTYFAAGDHSFEELIEDVKLGVYMRSFTEWNIDDRRYQSKYTGCEAYLITHGELTDTMVSRPVMETTSVGLLSSVDAVSKNFSFDFPGTCGKSDPGQGIPVYAGGGEIRFREIRLGGVG